MTLNNEEIVSVLAKYDRDSKAVREEILRICWYMRGSISYDDGMMLGEQDRVIVNKIIEENMEITKKSGLPFF